MVGIDGLSVRKAVKELCIHWEHRLTYMFLYTACFVWKYISCIVCQTFIWKSFINNTLKKQTETFFDFDVFRFLTSLIHIITYISVLNTKFRQVSTQAYHLHRAQYSTIHTHCQWQAINYKVAVISWIHRSKIWRELANLKYFNLFTFVPVTGFVMQ
jgi:hypothetical protein